MSQIIKTIQNIGTKLLSTHPVIKLQGTEALDFILEKMKEQAEKALNKAIDSYKERRVSNKEVYIPHHVSDACTAVALGWLVHVAPVPSITGSDVVVKTLTETTETLGLGKVVVEMDAEKTVEIYKNHIEKKRKELGLN